MFPPLVFNLICSLLELDPSNISLGDAESLLNHIDIIDCVGKNKFAITTLAAAGVKSKQNLLINPSPPGLDTPGRLLMFGIVNPMPMLI
jgi:hypothetical protein